MHLPSPMLVFCFVARGIHISTNLLTCVVTIANTFLPEIFLSIHTHLSALGLRRRVYSLHTSYAS